MRSFRNVVAVHVAPMLLSLEIRTEQGLCTGCAPGVPTVNSAPSLCRGHGHSMGGGQYVEMGNCAEI